MFSKFQTAIGIAVLLTLIVFSAVHAKGDFSFIAITGGALKEEVRVTDSNLTNDFFTFADFYTHKTKAPENPGMGYEITRYYVEDTRESAFDRLHYYPDTGYVFYDGLVNGSSEYDGEWYTAKPEIKAVFENAIGVIPVVKSQPTESMEQAQVDAPVEPVKNTDAVPQPPYTIVLSIAAGLLAITVFAFSHRKGVVK